MFCEMGHWYSFATREYILNKMNFAQFLLYYRNIPAEGTLTPSKKTDDKADIKAIKKFMGGKKVLRR